MSPGHYTKRTAGVEARVFAAWTIGLPLLRHTASTVALVYLASAAVVGLTLSVVFQLAHCVPEAIPAPGRSASWAVCQVVASVDFARGEPELVVAAPR